MMESVTETWCIGIAKLSETEQRIKVLKNILWNKDFHAIYKMPYSSE